MISLKRLAGIAVALAAVVSALALLDGALLACLDPLSALMEDDEYPTDWVYIERVGSKIAAAQIELERNGDPRRPVGLFLGQSTANWLDVELLTELYPDGPRWLNAAGVGGTINKVRFLSDIAAESNLPITEVVLAINTYMLAGNTQFGWENLQRSDPLYKYKKYIWYNQNSMIANHLFRLECYRLRVKFLHAFGLGADAIFPSSPYPWKSHHREPTFHEPLLLERAGRERIEWRIGYNASMGWYNSSAYTAQSSNAQSFLYLLDYWQSRGCRVTVVLLPDSSDTRRLIPPAAFEVISQIVAERGKSVRLVDLRNTIPDDGFWDLDHELESVSWITVGRIAAALRERRD